MAMNERNARVIEIFSQAKLGINEKLAEKFVFLTDFMLEYNEKINLTAIKEFDEVIIKHYIDSILPLTMVDIPEGSTIIDVGTGAGFPSIPMMLYRGDLKFTLCDSLNKRCIYLQTICGKLGLRPEIVHARGEEFARKNRETFDFATARAVAAMPTLTEFCLPFVKVGGKFIAMKSVNENIDEASSAIKLLGGKIGQKMTYSLPNGDGRLLAVVEKTTQTPVKYPRASGIIAKKPL